MESHYVLEMPNVLYLVEATPPKVISEIHDLMMDDGRLKVREIGREFMRVSRAVIVVSLLSVHIS